MKSAFILMGIVALLGSIPAHAQLTTWQEDVRKAHDAESQQDFAKAEDCYRHALMNFPDTVSTRPRVSVVPGGGMGRQSIKSIVPSCNCTDGQKCAETLRGLLGVLYAQNKLNSALIVCKVLVNYLQRTSSSGDSSVKEARKNYKKLLQRVETDNRWEQMAPYFRKYKFVGLDRTRVHEILGSPSSSYPADSAPLIRRTSPVHLGSYRTSQSDYPTDGLLEHGHRDFYVLSNLIADPPRVLMTSQGSTYTTIDGQPGCAYSFLDIDYNNKDLVLRYRLRSRDQTGKWVIDSSEPHLEF